MCSMGWFYGTGLFTKRVMSLELNLLSMIYVFTSCHAVGICVAEVYFILIHLNIAEKERRMRIIKDVSLHFNPQTTPKKGGESRIHITGDIIRSRNRSCWQHKSNGTPLPSHEEQHKNFKALRKSYESFYSSGSVGYFSNVLMARRWYMHSFKVT